MVICPVAKSLLLIAFLLNIQEILATWNNGGFHSGCSGGNFNYRDDTDTVTLDCDDGGGDHDTSLWIYDSNNNGIECSRGPGRCTCNVEYDQSSNKYTYNGVELNSNDVTCQYTLKSTTVQATTEESTTTPTKVSSSTSTTTTQAPTTAQATMPTVPQYPVNTNPPTATPKATTPSTTTSSSTQSSSSTTSTKASTQSPTQAPTMPTAPPTMPSPATSTSTQSSPTSLQSTSTSTQSTSTSTASSSSSASTSTSGNGGSTPPTVEDTLPPGIGSSSSTTTTTMSPMESTTCITDEPITPPDDENTTPSGGNGGSSSSTPSSTSSSSSTTSSSSSTTTTTPRSTTTSMGPGGPGGSSSTTTKSPNGQSSPAPNPFSTTPSPIQTTTIQYGSCCADNGVWSSWKLVIPCSDSCGSCAQTVHERTCLSLAWGCPCTGYYTKNENCNFIPCKYPRLSCCNGTIAMADRIRKKIICGPQPVAAAEPPMTKTCVPYGGVWSDWGVWSNCTGAPCGECGTTTRNRTCECMDLGCECQGSATETKPCKVVGIWSAWSDPSQCTDSCGGYGNMTQTRTCTTPNCPCEGDSTKMSHCAFKPCYAPREPCNCECGKNTTHFHLMYVNGQQICGPLPPATPNDLPPEPTPCDNMACVQTSTEPIMNDIPRDSELNNPPVPESSSSTTTTPIPCPAGGVWSDWSSFSTCTDNCGNCGTTTSTRTCLSMAYNCPCEGSEVATEACNSMPCKYPKNSCCTPFIAKGVPGGIACVE